MITDDTKNKIIEAANIFDVVSDKVQLKKAGQNWTGKCPFHNEKTGSFTVSPAKNIYKCFGCQKSGDSIQFIRDHDNLNFPEALRYLAAKYNILIEEKEVTEEDRKKEDENEQLRHVNEMATVWFNSNLFKQENAQVLEYALSRFSMDEIIEYRIGFAPDDWHGLLNHFREAKVKEEFYLRSKLIHSSNKGRQFDYYRNRLMFPVTNSNSRVIGFGGRVIPPTVTERTQTGSAKRKEAKYLNSPDTPVYDKSSVLYGLSNARSTIRNNDRSFLVEGYTDVLKLASLGVSNIVAPCGTALTNGQASALKRYSSDVCMIYDGDNAGQNAMIKNGELLLKQGFKVYLIPLPDKSDPGDYFTKDNISLLQKATPYIVWLSKQTFLDDGDPEKELLGVEKICDLLKLMPNESLQNSYIQLISKNTSVAAKKFTDQLRKLKKDTDKKDPYDFLPDEVDVKEYLKWKFYAHNNQYYFAEKGSIIPTRQTNFVMKSLFHTISLSDSQRIFEVINDDNHKIIATFDMNEMTSLQKFKKNLEEKGNFVFKGNDTHMTMLKEKLYKETVTCTEIRHLGWQSEGFWAWSNGKQTEQGFTPITEHGIIEHEKENYFIPAFSSIYKKDKSLFIDERKFKYTPGEISSFQWSEKLVQVFGDNAKVAVGFWIAAVFRDHILQIFKNFPIFNLFGPKGTGKSQLAISLTAMFGQTQTPFNLHNGTKPGLADHLSQFINGIAFLDEYKNSMEYDKIEVIKSIFDSIGRSRMNMDKKKKETTPVNTAVVICGQDMMTQDIALLSRAIFLQYAIANFTDAEKANYDEFKRWESKGFAHLTAELLQHRTYFEDNFMAYYDKTFADYNQKLAKENVEDRIVRSMCSIVAAFRCIADKMTFSFDYKSILEFTCETLVFHNKQLSKSNEVGTFWDIFESMFDEDKIIDKWHFRLDYSNSLKVNTGTRNYDDGKYFLKFKFNTIANLYSEHARRIGIKPLGIDTLRFYLENHKTYLGYSKNVKFHKKDLDKSEGKIVEQKQVTSAMVFMYEDLNVNLERSPIGAVEAVLNETSIAKAQVSVPEKPDDDLPF